MRPARAHVKFFLLLLITVLLAVMLIAHAPWLNGPSYWKWPWQRVDALRLFPAMLLAAAPLMIVVIRGLRARFAIPLIMLSMLAMQLVAIAMPQRLVGFKWVIYSVQSPMNTSYYADAYRSAEIPLGQFLADYPVLMPQFYMHSQEKPPGPILFFRMILQIFGESDRTALIAGLIIGVLSTATIPAAYAMIRQLTNDPRAAILGAAFLALTPGIILNFPTLDIVYPAITCVLIFTWAIALQKKSYGWAIGFGIALALACFIVYHFLVLGAFLGGITVLKVLIIRERRAGDAVFLALVSLAAAALFYLAMFAATGLRTIDVFRSAIDEQHKHMIAMHLPYPRTIVFDLADFALGAGWLAVLFLAIQLARRDQPAFNRWLVVLCLVQPSIIAFTGLMQPEAARIWCFMLPLMAIPVGLELSSWPQTRRIVAFACMWLILALVAQNMKFIFKPSEQAMQTDGARVLKPVNP